MGQAQKILHSSHWGIFFAVVEDGRIVDIEPFEGDPAPSPLLASIPEWTNAETRVLRPMVREGWLRAHDAGRPQDNRDRRGKDEFIEVSWPQAIELVASEINRVRTELGNSSIFAGSYGWTSAGRFHHAASQIKRLLNLVGGYTGHVDTYSIAAGPVLLRFVLGNDFASGGRGTTLDTVVENTQTLLVFGALSPRTAQNEAGGVAKHKLEGYLRQIADRGIRVILISPCRDDVPEFLNAEWWPIRPATDAALLLALTRELVRSGRADLDFLNRYCSGSERFLSYLAGETDGQEKTAEWAEAITGIPGAAIRGLAPTIADTRTMITLSWALQRADHGEQPYWAAIALAAAAGQIGLPGGGFGFGFGSVSGNGSPYGVIQAPALPQLKNPIRSFIPVARIADMLLNPGQPFDYSGARYTYPDARLIYWAGGNPFHHHQDLNRLDRAWAIPETVIVQDPVRTATVDRADIVLPACTTLERCDIGASRRSDYIVAMKKVVDPIGEARSDYAIVSEIARALGVEAQFTEGRDEMGWLRHLYENSRADAAERLNWEMPAFDEFWTRGWVQVPMLSKQVYLADFRQDPEKHPLGTGTGRIILSSETLETLGYDDFLPYPAWIPPRPEVGQGPLYLLTPQPQGRLHSQLDGGVASLAEKTDGLERLRINTTDARALGIESGVTVLIRNDRGRCLAAADVSDDVMPGVVCLPTGSRLQFAADGSDLEISGNPNVLTADIPASSFSQGCAAQSCRVWVERWKAPEHSGLETGQRGSKHENET